MEQAAGGRICSGWVTVEALEAAIGRPLGDVQVLNWQPSGEAVLLCEVRDGEDELLELRSRSGRDPRRRDEYDEMRGLETAVDGPLPGSVIVPQVLVPSAPEGVRDLYGMAPVTLEDGLERMLTVALRRVPEGTDGYAEVGRLLEELGDSALDGPPGVT